MKLMLIGLKHCGKSSVGKQLSKRWNCPFFDSDPMLLQHLRGSGYSEVSLRQYFQEVGAQIFYQQQTVVLKEFFASAPEHYILAAGGGIGESQGLLLPEKLFPLLLEEDLQVILQRFDNDDPPAFLRPDLSTATAFRELAANRLPVLRSIAKSSLHCRNRTIEEICDEIEELLAHVR